MPKKDIRYELIIAFERKYSPQDLIKMGVPERTAYWYHYRWKRAVEDFVLFKNQSIKEG